MTMRWSLLCVLAAFFSWPLARIAPGLEYPYAPYNEGKMDPQKTGWPLTEEERAYVLKPEHERRPGREANQHKPALWPVTPAAGIWGGTSWLDTHAKLVETVKANQGPIDVLLVGDSITMQWGAAWRKHFRHYKTVNIGIGGDKTQNVLWRLDHGGVAGLEPRLVVAADRQQQHVLHARNGHRAAAKASRCAWRICARSSPSAGHRGEDLPRPRAGQPLLRGHQEDQRRARSR